MREMLINFDGRFANTLDEGVTEERQATVE